MNKSKRSCLRQAVLAVMLTGAGVQLQAQELVLVSNQVTLGGNTVAVSADGRVASTTVSSANYGIPDLTFNLSTSSINPGTYSFRVGVTLDDDNSTSRIEMLIPKMDLTIDTLGDITSGVVDTAQKVRVLANDGDVTLSANITAPAGILTASGNSVSFEMGDLLTSIAANNASIQSYLDAINTNNSAARHYTYRIAIQGTGAAAGISLTAQGVPVPRIQSSCTLSPASRSSAVFVLNGSTLAGSFTSAYALQGQYSVSGAVGSPAAAPAAFEACDLPSGGGGGDEVNLEEAMSGVDQATSGVDNKIANGQAPTQAELNALVNANETLSGTLSNTDPATVTTGQLSELSETVGKLLATNAALSTSDNPNADVTASTNEVLENAAELLKDFSEKETLTAAEANAGLLIVKDLLDQAPDFFEGSDEDDKNLDSMNALLSATFTLGAKANPPVQFAAQDYEGAVEALDKLNRKNDTIPACENPALMGSRQAHELTAARPLDPGSVYFSTFIKFPPLFSTPLLHQPVFHWFSDFNFNPTMFLSNITVGCYGQVAFVPQAATMSSEAQASSQAATAVAIEKDVETYTLKVTLGDEKYIGSVYSISLLPSSLSEGLQPLLDGTFLLSQEGLGYTIGSSAADFGKFSEALDSLGYDLAVRADGGFDIQTGPTQKFSGVFAYDNVMEYEGQCGEVSIGNPEGPLNSPGYAFTATCATSGVTQRIVPYISQSSFYNLSATYGIDVQTDRNTGILSIEGMGNFKPDFFTNALSASDQTFLNANAVDGFAVRGTDRNGDGKMDLEVLHSSGLQILYGI